MKKYLIVLLSVFPFLHVFTDEVFCGRDTALPDAESIEQAWKTLVHEGNIEKAIDLFESIDKEANKGPALYMGLETVNNFRSRFDTSLKVAAQGLNISKHSPWGEIFLYDIVNLRLLCTDDSPAVKALEDLLTDTKVSFFLRDYALFNLANIRYSSGAVKQSKKMFKQLQFITKGVYCGPFPNRDGAGFVEAYPPEIAIDLSDEYEGINRKVTWMQYETQTRNGYIDYSAVFYPYENSVGYGIYSVHIPRSGEYLIHAGTGNSVKIWINYEEVFSSDEKNGLFFDRHVIRTSFIKGRNIIAIKLGTTLQDNEWGMFLRITGSNGEYIEDLKNDFINEDSLGSGVFSGRKSVSEPIPTPAEEYFLSVIKADPSNSVPYGTLGFVYSQRKKGDKTKKEALALYKQAYRLAPLCPLWGELAGAVDDDINKTIQVLEGLISKNNNAFSLKEAVCQILYSTGFYKELENKVNKLQWFKQSDEDLPGQILYLKAKIFNQREWFPEARALLRKASEVLPYIKGIKRIAVENTINNREITQYLHDILKMDHGNVFALKRLGDMAREKGDARAAEKYYSELIQRKPGYMQGYLRLSRLFMDQKKKDKAIAALNRAAQVFPQHPLLKETKGKILILSGNEEKGKDEIASALEIDPNRVSLKEYLNFLTPETETFYKKWDFQSNESISRYKGDENYRKFNTVDIKNVEVVSVNKNGTQNRMVHRLSKVLTEAGISHLKTVQIPFSSSRSRIEVKFARIIKPDGQVLQSDRIYDRSIFSSSSGGAALYSAYMIKVIQFPSLEKGDMVDYQYVIKDTSLDLFTDEFSDVNYLCTTVPAETSSYVISIPSGMKLNIGTFNTDVVPAISEDREQKRWIYSWTIRDWEGIVPERSMRPLSEYLPYTVVSTMDSWEGVGRWFYYLAKKQFNLNTEMKELVKDLTSNKESDREKVRSIFRYVRDEIRYVGIELGRGSYKPHRAESTFVTKYGDCKDTAVLMTALLHEAGIKADVVLVRTAHLGVINTTVPSPYVFNHAVCYVPEIGETGIWLDGTTDFYAMEEIPWNDQNAFTLVSGKDKNYTIIVPEENEDTSGAQVTGTVVLHDDGSAHITITVRMHGQEASFLRRRIHSPDAFKQQIERYYSRKFSGMKMTDMQTSPPDEITPVPWYSVSMEVTRFALKKGDELLLASSMYPLHLSGNLYEKERKFSKWLRVKTLVQEDLTITIPEQYTVKYYPEENNITVQNASFVQKTSVQGGTIRYYSKFSITDTTLRPENYIEYRDFCGKVDSAQEERIVLQKK